MIFSRKIFLLPSVVCAAFLLTGCQTTESGLVTISKVNPYHLESTSVVETDDEMIKFEQRRHVYGAVEWEEFREREGYYYTVFWNTKNKTPATVQFEYCLAATGPQVHVKEIHVSDPKRRNATRFEVIGDEYRINGRVTQWRATVVENEVVVAEYKSFLWK